MPRTFIDSFVEHRNGGAAISMQNALEEVIKAVAETGKAGKITLTIAVKPATRGGDVESITMADTIKVDLPRLPSKETVFFVGPDYSLSRQDQRQISMLEGMKDLESGPKATPREVR